MIHPEKVEKKGKITFNYQKLMLDHVPIIAPNGETILNDVSFNLEQGDHCFVDGANGSGKTSIFRVLS